MIPEVFYFHTFPSETTSYLCKHILHIPSIGKIFRLIPQN